MSRSQRAPKIQKPSNVVINEIKATLCCGICFGTLRDPRVLPCGHNLCFDCIVDYANSKKRENVMAYVTVRCPNNCPGDIPVETYAKIEALPKNYAIKSIIESMAHLGKCRVHTESAVAYVDKTTGDLLCPQCLVSPNQSAIPSSSSSIPPFVSEPRQVVDIYVAEFEFKSNLSDLVARTTSLRTDLETHLQQWQALHTQSQTTRMAAQRQIDDTFAQLEQIIRRQHEKLNNSLKKLMPEPDVACRTMDELKGVKHVLDRLIGVATNLLDRRTSPNADQFLLEFLTDTPKLSNTIEAHLTSTRDIMAVSSARHDHHACNYRNREVIVTSPRLQELLSTLSASDICKIESRDSPPVAVKGVAPELEGHALIEDAAQVKKEIVEGSEPDVKMGLFVDSQDIEDEDMSGEDGTDTTELWQPDEESRLAQV